MQSMLARGSQLCRSCVAASTVVVLPTRAAGHSKWHNIKHVKAAKDGLMAKRNHLHSNRIQLAIKLNNDTNPESNSALRKAISEAVAAQVPKATIDNAIKSSKKAEGLQEILLELKGPGSVAILVECLAKNRGHLDANIIPVLRKRGAVMDKGLANMFERKGVIISDLLDGSNLESAEEHAILSGAEDVTLEDDNKTLTFLTAPFDFSKVKSSLEELGYNPQYSSIDYIPQNTVDVGPIERKAVELLINSLEELTFVSACYSNLS